MKWVVSLGRLKNWDRSSFSVNVSSEVLGQKDRPFVDGHFCGVKCVRGYIDHNATLT